MILRSILLAAIAAVALAFAAAAPAYPPITCGQISVSGKRLVVRTHGPNCGFAERWVKEFIAHHTKPKGFTCRSYGKYVPADCKASKNRYFLANPAS